MPTKSHKEQCDAQMETSTKKPKRETESLNEQQKAFACFGFYLKNKKEQRRALKSNERQMETHTKNQNEQQRAFFIPIFIHSHQFWIYGRWLISRAMKSLKEQRRAMKSNEKLRRASKSYEEQQNATTDIGAGKTNTGKIKPRGFRC